MPASALLAFDLDLGSDAEAAAASRIGLRNAVAAVDQNAAGREVRTRDEVHQRAVFGLGIVDQVCRGVDQLADVVRWDGRRHADRDAARAVGQQVREQAGENLGLFFLAIVGRTEIDRTLVEAGHQLHGNGRQPRLGVTVGGGIIAVDVAEVPLPVDQRVAKRKILREADHRVIDATGRRADGTCR